MMLFAILGLLFTIAAACLAAVIAGVAASEGELGLMFFALFVFIALIALAAWQPVYWFTGVA